MKKKEKKTKKKKPLFITIIIIVIIVVIIIIAMPTINDKVSTLLNDTLENQIALQGLDKNITYDSITVNSLNGSVTVQGLTVQDYNFAGKITIDEVSATVPVQEIVSLAISPEKGVISDIQLAISGVKMEMKVEDVDVSLDLSTSEAQVTGRIDMNFVNNLAAGSVEPGIPQIDQISLNVGGAELNSSGVTLSLDSLLAEMGTVKNADSEPVSDFNISMTNIKMDADIGGENSSIIMLERYETQVQGPVVLELIAGLVSGNIEIDTSHIDSMKVSLERLSTQVPSEGSVNLKSLTAEMKTIKNVDSKTVGDFQISMIDAQMDGEIDGDDISLRLGSYETQVEGQMVLDLLDMIATGESKIDRANIDSMSMNFKDGEIHINDGTSDDKGNINLGNFTVAMKTVKNENNESISDFQISMIDAQMDGEIDGDDISLRLGSYETQVEGQMVLDLLDMIATGESKIDRANIDSMSMNFKDGEIHINDGTSDDKGNINLGNFTVAMKTVKNENNESISDFQISMTDAQMDGEIDGDDIFLSLGRYGTRVQGHVILDILDEFTTGYSDVDIVRLDSISMDLESAKLIAPELSMSVGSIMANLDGVESVLALMEYTPVVAPGFSGEMKVDDYTLVLNDELLEEFLSDLEMTFGPLPFLRDPESWKVDNLQMKLSLENGKAELSDLALNTGWLDISGSSSIGFSKEMKPIPPFKADLRVAQFPEDLRPLLGMMTAVLFQTELPNTNSFTVQINNNTISWGNI